MLNNKDIMLSQLRQLNLTRDEALIYMELLKSPKTHLRLSHLTGINRSKVYRLIEIMEKRSLITRRTDDTGTFLTAADPTNLEVELISHEEKIKQQRETFTGLVPKLTALQKAGDSAFIVRTYEGWEGLRQMVWHELKTKGEIVILGSGTTEELIPDHHWAEKHRTLNAQADYKVRELMNQGPGDRPVDFTAHNDFLSIYQYRRIPHDILPLDNQVSVYNDTVATYHWRQDQKVGVEIINKSYAQMMRNMFEEFWQMALPD